MARRGPPDNAIGGARGGDYNSPAKLVASSSRFRYDNDVRYPANGFRVVRELQ